MRRTSPIPIAFLILSAALLPIAGGCPSEASLGDALPSGDNGEVSFARDVQPIFTTICVRCHTGSSLAALEGIELDLRDGNAFASLVNRASDEAGGRTLVIPGDSDNSYLIEKLSESNPQVGSRMPLFGASLSAERIDLIRQWIEEGAANN